MRFTLRNCKLSIQAILLFLFISGLSCAEQKIPLLRLADQFALSVSYDALTGQIELAGRDHRLILYPNQPFIYDRGMRYFINGILINENGTLYLPENSSRIFAGIFDPSEKNDPVRIAENHDTEENNRKIESDLSVQENTEITQKDHPMLIRAIVIDPGHGGKDPGAIGYNGIREKDIVLKTGNILSEKLKTLYPSKKVIMTRSRDVFIELEDRAAIANSVYEKYGTTLFVSIHVNASRSAKSFGFETWHLTSGYTRDIAVKRKMSSDKETQKMLNSMLNGEIDRESRKLARYIQDELEKNIGSVSKNRGIKEESYFVIKKSIMPAVLVEIGFNTNKYEAIRLTKYGYLNKIAQGISEGIRKFINDYQRNQQ